MFISFTYVCFALSVSDELIARPGSPGLLTLMKIKTAELETLNGIVKCKKKSVTDAVGTPFYEYEFIYIKGSVIMK